LVRFLVNVSAACWSVATLSIDSQPSGLESDLRWLRNQWYLVAIGCTTLSNPIQRNGTLSSSADGDQVKHRTYVAILRREIIQKGIYCEFLVPDSAAPDGWDLLLQHGRFTLQEIKDHVFKMITAADTFQLENLDWSDRVSAPPCRG
jgi:hypothetical protein